MRDLVRFFDMGCCVFFLELFLWDSVGYICLNFLGLREIDLKLLTRIEELILFSVHILRENAYCIPIHEQIVKLTGENILLGSIYMPLDRLVKKEYLVSYLSESTPQTGGRHRRIYKLTPGGMEALLKVQALQQKILAEFTNLSLEEEGSK